MSSTKRNKCPTAIKPQKVDCRKCSNRGQEGDRMVFCKVLGCYRAFGLRYCTMFK